MLIDKNMYQDGRLDAFIYDGTVKDSNMGNIGNRAMMIMILKRNI